MRGSGPPCVRKTAFDSGENRSGGLLMTVRIVAWEMPRTVVARPDADPAVQRSGFAGPRYPCFLEPFDSGGRKDASFPNSDNRRFATSTSESIDSRRPRVVWTRGRPGRRGLTAHTELRRNSGTHYVTRGARLRTPLGPCRAAESCKPSERRHPDHGVFFRDCGEPVPPLTPLDTRPSGRNLKSSPNPDRDRSRQRSTLGARSRAASVDECFCPLSRSRSPPPISKLGRLDSASDARSPASFFRRPARRETAVGSSPTRL
jgi:hypothetical protein